MGESEDESKSHTGFPLLSLPSPHNPGKTGTGTAKVITRGAAADLQCAAHDTSTPEGLKSCSKDKAHNCTLTVSACPL